MISNQRILPNIEDVGGFVGDLRTKNLSVEIIPRFFSNVGTKLIKLLSRRLTTKDEILPNQFSQRIFQEVERIK